MDIHSSRFDKGLFTPDGIEELLPAEDLSLPLGKVEEEFEFGGAEFHGPPVQGNCIPFHVYLEPVYFQNLTCRGLILLLNPTSAV